ncbi:60S ribosomal protein L24 (nucleomorph) [Cryptomonas paramecium]|uniref:60S ribosomal protein L24 n=1 Tax=Cryptomonas paramaecium TaxID=2898 RepID=F2HI43_9CRYP|nr:60S ribosomal protein L24 [Cryptomonas paramecium]AEA39106.1 60S ribosomal protein L24 [Cryptomonas paramecium]|mmetsp:Transcript_67660/g.180895  ORF Transcript_67660/g.180895 Transcript_67660/m.180895 type:complete len:106 (-) Transcript_67660:1041-1358(-)
MYNLCYVCSLIVYPGHGSLLIKNNLDKMWFCSSKCRKKCDKKLIKIKKPSKINFLTKKISFLFKIKKKCKQSYNKYLILYTLYQIQRFKKMIHHKILNVKNFCSK